MIDWFRKRVDLPEFELVFVKKETSLHGDVTRRPGKKPRMRLFSTGMTESTVIHELAHLLAPPPKRKYKETEFGTEYEAVQLRNGTYRLKPISIHGPKFKAAQAKLWELWVRR